MSSNPREENPFRISSVLVGELTTTMLHAPGLNMLTKYFLSTRFRSSNVVSYNKYCFRPRCQYFDFFSLSLNLPEWQKANHDCTTKELVSRLDSQMIVEQHDPSSFLLRPCYTSQHSWHHQRQRSQSSSIYKHVLVISP